MWVFIIFFFLTIFDSILEHFKVLEICAFAILINKNILLACIKKYIYIDFHYFSAFKTVQMDKPIFLVYDKIRRDLKNLKKKKTKQNW